MSRIAFLAVVSLAILVACLPSPAPGCAIAPMKGQPGTSVQTATEQAVILFDEATRTEHFIRTASFAGTSANFGFLVPTPSKPEIAEADAGIYADLANVTKPRIEIRKVKRSKFSNGCGLILSADFSRSKAAMAPMANAEVNVVERKRVGNLDVSVLQAETPQALRDWFVKNGYDDRPELTEWLKPYTANKWFLSAYKMATDATGPDATTASKPNEPARPYALTSTTVKMSFKTDRPFYPYREPADAQTSNPPGGRLLRVYVVASTISAGLIGAEEGTSWPGRKVWAGQLPLDAEERLSKKAKLIEPGWAGKTLCLTEFEDRSSPRPGTDELYFGPSPDQSPVERPPTIQYEYIDSTAQDAATFFGIVFVAAIAFAIGLAALIRRLRKAT